MMATVRRLSFILAFCVCFSRTVAVQPIKVQGSDFVNTVTNDRFQIIGVAFVFTTPYKDMPVLIG